MKTSPQLWPGISEVLKPFCGAVFKGVLDFRRGQVSGAQLDLPASQKLLNIGFGALSQSALPLKMRDLNERVALARPLSFELLPAELFDGEVDGLCDGYYRPGKRSQILCHVLAGQEDERQERATVRKEDRVYRSLTSEVAFWT